MKAAEIYSLLEDVRENHASMQAADVQDIRYAIQYQQCSVPLSGKESRSGSKCFLRVSIV